MGRLHPVLRFVGSKSKLVNYLLKRFPAKIGGFFHDRTMGGCSVPLHLLSNNYECSGYRLSDLNFDVVRLHYHIRECVVKLLEHVDVYKKDTSEDAYYSMRDTFNKLAKNRRGLFFLDGDILDVDVQLSAMFLYLNRLCFNGVIRYNSSGEFNVPYGRLDSPLFDIDNIFNISEAFKKHNVLFTCMDMTELLLELLPDDFVYFDPPYLQSSKKALPSTAVGETAFSSYNAVGFSEADHLKLAYHLHLLHRKGVRFGLSGSDTHLYHSVFSAFNIESVESGRSVSGKSSGRGRATELYISNC